MINEPFDEEMNEFLERVRIIDELNKNMYQDRSRIQCEPGEHYPLINDLGEPQCAELECLHIFNYKTLKKELSLSTLTEKQKVERYDELMLVSRLVEYGTPPKNVICYEDNVYIPRQGFRNVRRCFYDKD